MIDSPADTLPEKPSRASGRRYAYLMFILAIVEFALAAGFGVDGDIWPLVLVINILPLSAMLIAKATTTLDLNKWMTSATEMVKAKYGAGQ